MLVNYEIGSAVIRVQPVKGIFSQTVDSIPLQVQNIQIGYLYECKIFNSFPSRQQ